MPEAMGREVTECSDTKRPGRQAEGVSGRISPTATQGALWLLQGGAKTVPSRNEAACRRGAEQANAGHTVTSGNT